MDEMKPSMLLSLKRGGGVLGEDGLEVGSVCSVFTPEGNHDM